MPDSTVNPGMVRRWSDEKGRYEYVTDATPAAANPDEGEALALSVRLRAGANNVAGARENGMAAYLAGWEHTAMERAAERLEAQSAEVARLIAALGEVNDNLRDRIIAGLKDFCAVTPDFDMSSAARSSAADFILGQPIIRPTGGPSHD